MLIKRYIFTVSILALLISGCSTGPAVIVKAGSGDQSVSTKAGKPFAVQLEGQLSTGYAWKITESPASFTIIKESVKTEEKDKTGGIDIQEFVLSSTEKGEFTITFKYARHWEKKPQYIKTSTVKVKIE